MEKKKAEIQQRKEQKSRIEEKLAEKGVPQDPKISTTTSDSLQEQAKRDRMSK